MAAPALRRVPRARRRGDDPAHPSRPPHRLEQGRLAAGARTLARARSRRTARSRRRPRSGTSTRVVADYAAAAQRIQAAGLDGLEIDAYGHFPDQFWSPATNHRDDEYGGSLDNRMRFSRPRAAGDARCGRGRSSSSACAWWPTRTGTSASRARTASRSRAASPPVGVVDFLNIVRGHMDTDNALSYVIPIHGMGSAPHLDFAGEVRAATQVPGVPCRAHQRRRDGAARDRRGQARHGGDDARAHRRPAYRAQGRGGTRASDPALRRRHLLPRPHLRGQRGALHPQRRDRAARRRCRT